ncbi:MAG TPA: glutamine synthetase family protein [Alphaproteobacteria bacterium]|nr:glutamine synthetase family protein [Alphaproteobacteria bacterium]
MLTDKDKQRYEAARKKLIDAGVKHVQAEIPDLDGMLRGKILDPAKAISGSGNSHCTIQFGASVQDNLIETPLGSFENGFPDLVALSDLGTLIQWPWAPKYASVLQDLYHPEDMRPCSIAPREVLRRQVEKARAMGFEPYCAVEYEAVLMHVDPELMRQGRHDELPQMSRTLNFYSLARLPDLRVFMEEFLSRMESIGIHIDAFHTEKGPGQIEFAPSYTTSLEAADQAIRIKYYAKQLCAERNIAITFMSRWNMREVGTGAHVHQSLWKNGRSAFSEGKPGTFSKTGRQYAAGMMRCMREFTAIVNPFVNSYRRRRSLDWCPENASWAPDNRSAALRVITRPSANSARIETRQPGGDANPYFSVATGLASGLYGIEHALTPPAYATGNAGHNPRFDRLPMNLKDATEAFKNSTIAREVFGDDFVDHYVTTRENEWRLWQEWLANNVTEWELRRYFETV